MSLLSQVFIPTKEANDGDLDTHDRLS